MLVQCVVDIHFQTTVCNLDCKMHDKFFKQFIKIIHDYMCICRTLLCEMQCVEKVESMPHSGLALRFAPSREIEHYPPRRVFVRLSALLPV